MKPHRALKLKVHIFCLLQQRRLLLKSVVLPSPLRKNQKPKGRHLYWTSFFSWLRLDGGLASIQSVRGLLRPPNSADLQHESHRHEPANISSPAQVSLVSSRWEHFSAAAHKQPVNTHADVASACLDADARHDTKAAAWVCSLRLNQLDFNWMQSVF